MPTVAANAVLPLSNKANFILWLVFVRLGNLVKVYLKRIESHRSYVRKKKT